MAGLNFTGDYTVFWCDRQLVRHFRVSVKILHTWMLEKGAGFPAPNLTLSLPYMDVGEGSRVPGAQPDTSPPIHGCWRRAPARGPAQPNTTPAPTMSDLPLPFRMNATITFVVFGIPTIGALLGGILGQYLGLPETLVIAAVGEMLACLWIVFSPLRTLRELKDLPEALPENEDAVPLS